MCWAIGGAIGGGAFFLPSALKGLLKGIKDFFQTMKALFQFIHEYIDNNFEVKKHKAYDDPTLYETISNIWKNHSGKIIFALAFAAGCGLGVACIFFPAALLTPILLACGKLFAPVLTASLGLQCFAVGSAVFAAIVVVMHMLKEIVVDHIIPLFNAVIATISSTLGFISDCIPDEDSTNEKANTIQINVPTFKKIKETAKDIKNTKIALNFSKKDFESDSEEQTGCFRC
jgi:hypothetical protein